MAPRIRYDPLQAAYTVAARYWGVVPCEGHITITLGPAPPTDKVVPAGSEPAMWSTWDLGTPYENQESAPQPFSSCAIGLNSAIWTSAESEGFNSWQSFAMDLTHEFGHLLGHAHSLDPANVMYPEPPADLALTGDFAPGWQP